MITGPVAPVADLVAPVDASDAPGSRTVATVNALAEPAIRPVVTINALERVVTASIETVSRPVVCVPDALTHGHPARTHDHRTRPTSRRSGLPSFFSSWLGHRPYLFVHPTRFIDQLIATKENFTAAGDELGFRADELTVRV